MFSLKKYYTSRLFLLLIGIWLINFWIGDDRVPKWGFTGGCKRDASQQGQPCPDPTDNMTPMAQVGTPKLPTTSAKYIDQICPFLSGKEIWCNDDQILVMYSNFKTIDSLFGDCLLCSTNLKRFWCEYTCSPYQWYFVDSFEQIKDPDVDYPVLNQSMRVESSVVWDLYNSCKKNPFVTSLASGQSAVGFLEFMGSNAVQTGKVKINFDFTSDPENTLMMDMYAWDMEVDDILDGYHVQKCTWNYWEAACTPIKGNAMPAFFDGFNFIVVIIVYVSLIILSVIIYFIKRKWQTDQDEDEPSYFDDEDPHKKNLLNSSLDRASDASNKSTSKEIADSYRNESYGKINSSSVEKSVNAMT